MAETPVLEIKAGQVKGKVSPEWRLDKT
jgi:hypothetical protein